MAILSLADHASLKSELATAPYLGLSAQAAADRLNAPGAPVANPVAAAQVPFVLSELALFSLLTDPANNSGAKLLNWPNLGLLKADIDANDHAAVAAWAVKLKIPGLITAGESDAILALVGSTVADPAHPATVPGPTRKAALFGAARWTLPDGRTVDYITPEIVAEALS